MTCNYFGIAILFSTLCGGIGCSQQPPMASISNGVINAELYLPDSVDGYYRGARFDWSGVMPELNYKGHSYFGQWFENYDPKLHDAIMGPVEAFDPLGFENANVGETFIKIGIGELIKFEEADYHFSKPYEISNHGVWTVNKGKGQVEFIHVLKSGTHPYTYKKVVRLDGNKMIIDHSLTNNGESDIDTQVFNHNFIVIDEDRIGPGYSLEFPFEVEADTSGLGNFAHLQGNRITYVNPLGEDDRARLRDIKGFGPASDDYLIVIENKNTGAGVRISCDQPISKMIFWSMYKTLCPEPYIRVKAGPSENSQWTIVYEFYTL